MLFTENVMIIMNGPTVNQLNWDEINSQLLTNKLTVIVTNGFLTCEKIIDSPNVIFIINDPLIELILTGEINNIENPSTKDFLIKNYHFDNDHLNALKYDIISCHNLLKTNLTKVAMRSNALCKKLFDESRIINFDLRFIDKVLIKFSYKWHQNGFEPANILNRYGIKTFPYESRLVKYLLKYQIFSKIWYKINFFQTPNTFYRALDLSVTSEVKYIFFIGRNSQIDDWLNTGIKFNQSIEVKYSYFFTNNFIRLKINDFQSILREIYYSSQYIKMLNCIFVDKRIISLENTFCYKDFFDQNFATKYLK
jgi:hypothetical protein